MFFSNENTDHQKDGKISMCNTFLLEKKKKTKEDNPLHHLNKILKLVETSDVFIEISHD